MQIFSRFFTVAPSMTQENIAKIRLLCCSNLNCFSDWFERMNLGMCVRYR